MGNYPGKRKGTRRIVIWTSGRPREWTIRGTKADGERFEAQKRIELGETQHGPRGAVDFSTLCREYSIHAQAHLKESTWKVRKYIIVTLEEHFGQLPVSQFTVPRVDGFKLTRMTEVGAVAVNNELGILSAILTYGRSVGYPIPKLKWKQLPERGHGRVKVWSGHEIQRIFAACKVKAPRLLPMLVFMANTGVRKGEALAAEWSWADFKAELIRIPTNEYWQPKNDRPREVPMSETVKRLLRGRRRHDRWIFPNRWNKRFTIFPHLVWQKVLVKAGVKGNPHMFRHTFASVFLQKVPDMFLLAQILGHSTTRVTELYSHLLPGHLEKARGAVDISPMVQRGTRRRPEAKRPYDRAQLNDP